MTEKTPVGLDALFGSLVGQRTFNARAAEKRANSKARGGDLLPSR